MMDSALKFHLAQQISKSLHKAMMKFKKVSFHKERLQLYAIPIHSTIIQRTRNIIQFFNLICASCTKKSSHDKKIN
ncbi:CLUMA_CG011861, isoform A [Clunio marinus]|uniref:CLUMA_CG011861, isoform A n=1 Tax=Clunio marinus TaxID=568069 RepID=A0A1J1IJ88_9DIPT|nr:CLUMA_CG011861, isoform A [Clunio marinus]